MFLQFFVGFAKFESRPPESEATSRILQWLVESSWLDWRRGLEGFIAPEVAAGIRILELGQALT